MNTQTELHNLFSGLSSADIRKLVIAHGTTVHTDSGPQYRACHCELCEYGREALADARMASLGLAGL